MSVVRNRLASLLEEAAQNIGNLPRENLQALLRRAALVLRNIEPSGEAQKAKRVIDEFGWPSDQPRDLA